MMDCRAVREQLSANARSRLDAAAGDQVAAHLVGCVDCRRAAAVEEALDATLDRLPRHHAPESLKRRLEALVGSTPATVPATPVPKPPAVRPRRWIWAAPFVSACAAAALVLVVVRAGDPRPSRGTSADLVEEAVNDHLRVVSSSHPVEIESGGIHQVKPWFTGRLDFAPRVAFSGDADFPLVGGSIGYFRDRKAAVFVFKRRLHTITLLVFPPDGLAWPSDRLTRQGRLSISEETARGFSVLLWRDEGQGYALISDTSRPDLELLASRINTE